jgi:hypothetical protein
MITITLLASVLEVVKMPNLRFGKIKPVVRSDGDQ